MKKSRWLYSQNYLRREIIAVKQQHDCKHRVDLHWLTISPQKPFSRNTSGIELKNMILPHQQTSLHVCIPHWPPLFTLSPFTHFVLKNNIFCTHNETSVFRVYRCLMDMGQEILRPCQFLHSSDFNPSAGCVYVVCINSFKTENRLPIITTH